MDRVLDRVNQPGDLKNLSLDDLRQLAREIRAELVSVVSQTGGHLASNLGAVELTIALHRVFQSPRDRIVWDVGHQAYVHKLLTGRKDRFRTIRQFGGLSGFTTRDEGPHDPFGAGHAGTSVSAALGMAVARDLASEDFHVVAVIGDGALTCGMALEALNHAGHLGSRLIVVFNDNAMSISPNVGALSRMFNKLRLDPRYHRAKEGAGEILTRLPLGSRMLQAGRRFKDSFKGLVIPTMIWEELGFTYMGPVDGHDIAAVMQALAQAKTYPTKPTFIHVLTTKGKGYEAAEADPIKLHGISPSGGKKSAAPPYTQVFAETVQRLMQVEPRLVAITAAMLEGTGLVKTAQEFPQRVVDVGICEQHAVTFAAGLATQGYIPVVAIYSTFLQRAYDQIIHDVCTQRLPVIFAMDRAGVVGDDGKTHQGAFDLTYLRALPEMVVGVPADENELQHMVYTAYQHAGIRRIGPFALRFPRGAGFGVTMETDLHELPVGQGELLRAGRDVGILAVGPAVSASLAAAERLAREGIECAVVNVRWVKPLDGDLVSQLARTCRLLVTVEENALMGGFGSAVLELLADRGWGVPVRRLGFPDDFVEHGSQSIIRAQLGLDAGGIAASIREGLGIPVQTALATRSAG
ncbi:MAG: 1-deoxy-D-xylulose-5-phosphate synthase [Chloroflexi bacterium]|nr:1-deoxy-D-xylulose-5-phosphate synthase [Chloroflexota bacterium]